MTISDSGTRQVFASGAVRDIAEGNGRCDLLPLDTGAILELSKHYEEGAKKYSPHNWKLGVEVHCYIDSALRHYFKYLRGDTDEPHDRAVLWNLVGALWTSKHHPELNDAFEDLEHQTTIL